MKSSSSAVLNAWVNTPRLAPASAAGRQSHGPIKNRVSSVAQQFPHHFGKLRWKQICIRELIGECEMSLMTVVITICVVGVLLWLINRFIPMQSQIKGILNGVVVIVLVVWLLNAFGLIHYLTQFRVGK
jgi:hypothetical protein